MLRHADPVPPHPLYVAYALMLPTLYARVRRLHLHDFNAFLLTVLALAAGIVAVFVATRGGAPPPGSSWR